MSHAATPMSNTSRSGCKDIHWHIKFFHDVCGMTMREVQGTAEEPVQYWTLGGMQFIAKPDFAGPEGRLGHLGVMCDDLEAALAAAQAFGVDRDAAGPQLAAPARRSGRRIHPGQPGRRGAGAGHQSRAETAPTS